MIYNIIAGCAAIYMTYMALITKTENRPSRLMFNVIPGFLGISLGFFVVAKFMGWPI